jgi:type II secretory pathway pseudopilin PulG
MINNLVFRHKKGFALVELIFAIGIITVLLTVLVASLSQALMSSQFAKNNAMANRYVEEGLELARQSRDQASDWQTFSSPGPISSSPLPSPFTGRIIEKSNAGADKIKVTVTVTWTDNKGSHTVIGTTYLTKWKYK